MVIGKCTDVFRGIFGLRGGVEGRGVIWEDLSMKEFKMQKRISMEGRIF